MTIQSIKYPYEILIRFTPDGIGGAHFIENERIVDGDKVLSETVGAAQPIPAEQINSIYPEAQALADLSAALGEIAELSRALEKAEGERDAARQENANLMTSHAKKVEKLEESVSQLSADNTQNEARVAELMKRIDDHFRSKHDPDA